jgi:hypothetical protein
MSEVVRWRVARAGNTVKLIEVKRRADVVLETERWRYGEAGAGEGYAGAVGQGHGCAG